MLAVQAVAVEEDEVRGLRAVDGDIDTIQPLDRGPWSALGLRVERPNAHHAYWCIGLRASRVGGAALLSSRRVLRLAPALRLLATPGSRPTFAAPPLLDFRHAVTDYLLRM